MTATTVQSTMLAAVAYDGESRCLWLEFRNHVVYNYAQVPQAVVDGLLAAPSKGAYFHRNIRGRFAYRRINSQTPLPTPQVAGPQDA